MPRRVNDPNERAKEIIKNKGLDKLPPKELISLARELLKVAEQKI